MGESKKPNIYNYLDFREFLRDYYEFKKSGPKGYSYRSFSKAGGFSSPNVLKLVIEGSRNISEKSINAFAKALLLNDSEKNYFSNLVLMNQAKTDKDKDRLYHQLLKLLPYGKKRNMGEDTMEYLSHWIHPVLREMVSLSSFSSDPHWIQRRLVDDVSVREISKALKFLEDEKYIEKDGSKWSASDKVVVTSDEIKDLAIRNYHRQMLLQAAKALETTPMESREFGALTLLMPEEKLDELKQKLKEVRQELHRWSLQQLEEHDGDAIVQLNIQMYPHTKNKG